MSKKKHRDEDDFARDIAAKKHPPAHSNQQDKNPLAQIGDRYWKGHDRANAGTTEWVEGSLEMAAALAEARDHFTADQDFGQWLKEDAAEQYQYGEQGGIVPNDHDRAALISPSRRALRPQAAPRFQPHLLSQGDRQPIPSV
jgi:hypothetical protein